MRGIVFRRFSLYRIAGVRILEAPTEFAQFTCTTAWHRRMGADVVQSCLRSNCQKHCKETLRDLCAPAWAIGSVEISAKKSARCEYTLLAFAWQNAHADGVDHQEPVT